ncbi:hypothetical protein FQN54_006039 [Arachnomyces sp. PD_36]|nr:hypothetical protein FQN54_006039 [Arachnomyces sp. PD_36]
MAAAAHEDVLTKISTDAATDFVQSFYLALQTARGTIASFYSPTPAKILFNGNIVQDGSAVQEIFVNQMPAAHYEVQSFDCQVLNQNYPPQGSGANNNNPDAAAVPPQGPSTKGGEAAAMKNMSILVLVSGNVRYGESRDLPHRGFSESVVLAPNPAVEQGVRRAGRGKKDWLIQSQNFRLVV